jgi:hypothetical protein
MTLVEQGLFQDGSFSREEPAWVTPKPFMPLHDHIRLYNYPYILLIYDYDLGPHANRCS